MLCLGELEYLGTDNLLKCLKLYMLNIGLFQKGFFDFCQFSNFPGCFQRVYNQFDSFKEFQGFWLPWWG